MERQKIIITVIISFGLAVCALLLGYKYSENHRTRMVTNFQDPSGWFYSCSKPIPATWATVPHLSGESSRQLVAASPSDVAQYCHEEGIE